jgi:hypothetical protein
MGGEDQVRLADNPRRGRLESFSMPERVGRAKQMDESQMIRKQSLVGQNEVDLIDRDCQTSQKQREAS